MKSKTANCWLCNVECYPSSDPSKAPSCREHAFLPDRPGNVSEDLTDELLEESVSIEFPDKKESVIDPYEWLSYAKEGKALQDKAKSSQNEATVIINTDHPVSVCFSADWHLGSSATDYDQLLAHHKFIKETNDLYVITVGDLIQNTRIAKPGGLVSIFEQVIPPHLQGKVAGKLFDDIKHKLLAACWGNHDVERDEKLFGESPLAEHFSKDRPFFNGIGKLTLIVNDIPYKIMLNHKARGHSAINPLSGNYKLFQLNWAADVTVTAHTHNPAMSTQYNYDQKTIFIKCGSLQLEDPHADRYFGTTFWAAPTVVFMPDRKEMTGLFSPEEAVAYMKGLK